MKSLLRRKAQPMPTIPSHPITGPAACSPPVSRSKNASRFARSVERRFLSTCNCFPAPRRAQPFDVPFFVLSTQYSVLSTQYSVLSTRYPVPNVSPPQPSGDPPHHSPLTTHHSPLRAAPKRAPG